MRKHWKHENIVNVRIALMRKSRKAVKPDTPAAPAVYKGRANAPGLGEVHLHPKFKEMQDALVQVKDLVNMETAKSIIAEYGYSKIAEIKWEHVVYILTRANKVIYDYTH